MFGVINIIRRTIEGSISAIALIAVVAFWGGSETINLLLSDLNASSTLFLAVMTIVLADLIAKLINIVDSTFPDLIPKVDNADLKRVSLIKQLRAGQTMALLSGASAARVVLFGIIFTLLGSSYAAAPENVQSVLFGDLAALEAANAFLREGIAGSVGYFLFFLGPDNLRPITSTIVSERLVSSTIDGDVFLAGIRLYGFAFVLAVLRTLITPLTYLRARLRARKIETEVVPAAPGSGADDAARMIRFTLR